MDDYISKPVNADELKNILEKTASQTGVQAAICKMQ
jgi:YesN/AraC family two-component response regulator